MTALVPIILEQLPNIVIGVEHLISYLRTARTAMQQSGEWTPEHEAQFVAGVIAHGQDPAFTPDAK